MNWLGPEAEWFWLYGPGLVLVGFVFGCVVRGLPLLYLKKRFR